MTQCPSCGTMVPDGTQFCLECGKSIASVGQQTAESIPYSSSSSEAATAVYAPYSTAPSAYPPQIRNPYRLLSIVLGVLLLAATVVLIIVLSSVSGKSAISTGMSPGKTVEAVYKTGTDLYDKLAANKLTKGDLLTAYETMQDVLPTEVTQEMIRRMKMEVDREGGLPTVEVVDETVNGDRATVTVRIRVQRPGSPPREETAPIPMIKENGKWKFDVMRGLRPMY